MKNLFKLTCTFALASMLAACTSQEDIDNFNTLSQDQKVIKLQSLNNLEEHGKLALITHTNSKLPAINCTYKYKKSSFSLELTGPMGMQYAMLEVYAGGTTYLKISGDLYKGDNARKLLKQEFNLDIPVEDIPSIMLGTPKGKLSYDENGFVKSAVYKDEYMVKYSDYTYFRGGYPLPKGIEIINALATIKIRIYEVTVIN